MRCVSDPRGEQLAPSPVMDRTRIVIGYAGRRFAFDDHRIAHIDVLDAKFAGLEQLSSYGFLPV